MDAVVLAAGVGRRMGPCSDRLPKCLVSVGGEPLLVHSLRKLIATGFSPIVVVTGHLAAMIERAVAPLRAIGNIILVDNPRYDQTGTASSLCCAEASLASEGTQFLLIEGDLLYDAAFLQEANRHRAGTIFTADLSGSGDEVYVLTTPSGRLKEVSKVISEDGKRQVRAGTTMMGGELAGISVLPKSFISYLGMRRWLIPNFDRRDYESFLCEFGEQVSLTACWLRNLPWAEVDTLADLERVRTTIWPRIDAGQSADRSMTRAAEPVCRIRLPWSC